MPMIKEILSGYFNKKYKGIVIMAAAGILLVAFSSLYTDKKPEIKENYVITDVESLRKKKEKELEEFL